MNASALLAAQGWRGKGHSLHKTDDSIGLAKPLLLNRKDNTKGLGTTQHFTSDQWWMNAFDEQLKGLDTTKEGKVSQTVKTGKLNAIEKASLGKYSLYTSFVRGGLLQGTLGSLATSEDSSSSTESDDAGDQTPDTSDPEEKQETQETKKIRKKEKAELKAARRKEKEEKRARKEQKKQQDKLEVVAGEETREERKARREEKKKLKEQKRKDKADRRRSKEERRARKEARRRACQSTKV